MKKIMFFAAALFMLLLTACNGCNNEPVEPADDAVVIKTENFEEMVSAINEAVNAKFPKYAFYEAHGILNVAEDGTVTVPHDGFEAAYGNTQENGTVIAVIVNDTLRMQEIKEPWLEDLFTTPFVSTTLDEAVEIIQGQIDVVLNGQPCVLRHQLAPNIHEPQFIIGTWANCHSVEVYSRRVDVPCTHDAPAVALKESGLKKEEAK